jgi:lysophospholipase L1-like esterase
MSKSDKPSSLSARRDAVLLLMGTIGGLIVLGTVFSGKRAFEEAALGNMTVAHEGSGPEGENTHCQRIKEEDHDDFVAFAAKQRQNIVILGNSQTHSINQKQPGETVYPELIQRKLDSIGILTHSMPNANLQEFLVSHAWWSQHVKPDMVVVPAFMDDLREDGLRADFMKTVVSTGFQLDATGALETTLNAQLDALTNPPSEAGSESEDPTPQDLSEAALNTWLEDHTAVWRNRSNARGDLFLTLYGWRNHLFGISASTHRKMIPARYDRNLQALRLLCVRASREQQQVLIYIPPIRTDVAPPYDPREYAVFKEEIASLTEGFENVQFANLEDIVPGPLWGVKASTDGDGEPELDFMHFQFKGHEILADALLPYLTP